MRFRLIVAAAIGLAAGVFQIGAMAADGLEMLPEGPGRETTIRACVGCHEADVLAKRPLSPDEWKEMVQLMVVYGAVIDDKEKAEITDYLIKAFPAPGQAAAAP